MAETLSALLSGQGLLCIEGAPMAEWTTLRVGGPADLLVQARDARDIAAVLRALADKGAPLVVVGGGSNLLVRDGGVRGVVLVVGEAMSDARIDGDMLIAQAGVPLSKAARLAQRAGLSGLETLSGIPGTVGGAACMNAGAHGAEMADIVESVDVLDTAGAPHTLAREALSFGYRKSALTAQNLIVTGVRCRLRPDDPEAISRRMADMAARRREKQPLTLPSAGSFFKRPEGGYASALTEQAGMKGAAVGGAQVSEKHVGFFVNKGNATARDFIELMALVQDKVFAMSGVMLEPEVRILGCDSSC